MPIQYYTQVTMEESYMNVYWMFVSFVKAVTASVEDIAKRLIDLDLCTNDKLTSNRNINGRTNGE